MGARRDRRNQRAEDMRISKSVNGPLKAKERDRRAARMKAILKSGSSPYPRHVRSWLSAQLGKSEYQITPEDVQKLLKA